MKLLNADGSAASSRATACAARAILIRGREAAGDAIDPDLEISTTAGLRRLRLTGRDGSRYVLDADMGQPVGLIRQILSAGGETVTVSTLSMGNPQCVLLGPLPDDERFVRLGPALERHPSFPSGTNVEFALVEAPDRVRIRIWERGVGPNRVVRHRIVRGSRRRRGPRRRATARGSCRAPAARSGSSGPTPGCN
jgi:diaminopimelate epimerase